MPENRKCASGFPRWFVRAARPPARPPPRSPSPLPRPPCRRWRPARSGCPTRARVGALPLVARSGAGAGGRWWGACAPLPMVGRGRVPPLAAPPARRGPVSRACAIWRARVRSWAVGLIALRPSRVVRSALSCALLQDDLTLHRSL
jgi:hypothetical protein